MSWRQPRAFALRLHASAAPPRVGLTQALAVMSFIHIFALFILTSTVTGCAATSPTRHPESRYKIDHNLMDGNRHFLVLVPYKSLGYSFDISPNNLGMSDKANAIARADFLAAAQRYCGNEKPVLEGNLDLPWGSISADRIDAGRIVSAGSLSGLLKISGIFVCR